MQFQLNEIHYARYDYLNYCRYVLIDMVNYADKNKSTITTIPFKNDKDKDTFAGICESKDIDGMKWLMDNGYEEAVYDCTYKHIFFSMLVDFSNFYIASIEQAFIGNMTVAWSLLRRPLQETLAYIEWLLVDNYELPKRMLNEKSVEAYDLKARKNHKLRKSIIDEVYKGIKTDDFNVYDFRYSKKDKSSLDGILNGATHLITTYNEHFKTAPSSFNFVFDDEAYREKSVNMYFTSVPFVMHYAMHTIMKLFGEIADLKPYTLIMNEYNHRLKSLKAMQTMSLEEGVAVAEIELPIYCTKCGNKMESLDDWQAYAYKSIQCKQCKNEIDTFGYIFDFEEIEFTHEQ